ncbi:MAG: hypothetical protein JW395_0156 [Nitrospira sp.]|nr:hypothetical protein [Nitrospira sp.]
MFRRSLGGTRPEFAAPSSALWRGYVGTREIRDDRLYLIELTGRQKSGHRVTLATLFPDFSERVFAHWSSRTLRVPQGGNVKYVHSGFASVYERDLFLKIDKGIVRRTWTRENGKAQDGAERQGYQITALTTFGQPR